MASQNPPSHAASRSSPPVAASSGRYPRPGARRVLLHPDPRLAECALDVDPRDPAIVALADELVAMMRKSPGCTGLAAPQLGVRARVFCVDVTGVTQARSCSGLVVLANPRVVARSELVALREGCLSVPHLTGNVARAAECVIEGTAPGTDRLVRVSADGLEARCLEHEIDHLDGFLFVDRVLDPGRDLFYRERFA